MKQRLGISRAAAAVVLVVRPFAIIAAGELAPVVRWILEKPASVAHPARRPLSHVLLISGMWLLFAEALAAIFLGVTGLYRPAPDRLAQALVLVSMALLSRRLGVPAMPGYPGLAGCLALASIARAGASLWQPGTIREWDSVHYHLPAMRSFIAHGRLVLPWTRGGESHYPFTWEAMDGLLAMATGSERTLFVTNLLAWGFLGLCVYVVARELGASRSVASIGCALAMQMPVSLEWISSAMVDKGFAAAFLAVVAAWLLYIRASDRIFLTTSWLGLAAALSLKASGVPYCLLFAALAALFHRRHLSRQLPSLWLVPAGVFVGAYWYARNAISTGNIFGMPRNAGPILIRTTFLHDFRGRDPSHWAIVRDAMAQELGLALVVSVAVSLLLAWPILKTDSAAFCSLMVGGLAVCFVTSPFSGSNATVGFQLTPWIAMSYRLAYACLFLSFAVSAATVSRIMQMVGQLPALSSLTQDQDNKRRF